MRASCSLLIPNLNALQLTNHCSRIIFGEPTLIQQLQVHSDAGVATSVIICGELFYMAAKSEQRIQALTYHRNRFVENYLHNTSRLIVNRLKQQGIGTLVIGKNEGWKQQVHKGKRNNQKFVNIPHALLIDQITYKCELAGIKVVIIEESYTSKTSAIDLEPPCKQSKYAGRRVKRGLFKSSNGRVINADINGSIQIIRKYLPEAFTAEGVVSCAVQPIRVNKRVKD